MNGQSHEECDRARYIRKCERCDINCNSVTLLLWRLITRVDVARTGGIKYFGRAIRRDDCTFATRRAFVAIHIVFARPWPRLSYRAYEYLPICAKYLSWHAGHIEIRRANDSDHRAPFCCDPLWRLIGSRCANPSESFYISLCNAYTAAGDVCATYTLTCVCTCDQFVKRALGGVYRECTPACVRA